jgi:hypothetical protein
VKFTCSESAEHGYLVSVTLSSTNHISQVKHITSHRLSSSIKVMFTGSQNLPSHRMFEYMHKVLNIDEKNKLHSLIEKHDTNILSLISLLLDTNYQI